MATSIWWVRRDLRLADNPALAAALAAGERVVPLFILDPVQLASTHSGEKSLGFFLAGLRSLDADLRARGGRLVARRGDPAEELARVCGETGAAAIYAQADVSPFARQRDERVAERLPLRLTAGLTVHPSELIRKADGGPFTRYASFRRAWLQLSAPARGDLLAAPTRVSVPAEVAGDLLPADPSLPGAVPFAPGEAEAQRRLEAFAEGETAPIASYGDLRDRVDVDSTSRLSPYLRFGMLSARQAAVAAVEAAARTGTRHGSQIWLDEVIWRDYFVSILHSFPAVLLGPYDRRYDDIAWDSDPACFAAWRQGLTGYPVVDAAMRQLMVEGWIHNRLRLIVASFLVKDLLVDWRAGERWFMQQLVDGDPSANNGNWQWVAGVGPDPAPYFRVFNPVLQGRKFDPEGRYARRWLPELARVPDRFIHEPWRLSPQMQTEAGCVIGRDYPAPMVEHAAARERTLAAYRAAR